MIFLAVVVVIAAVALIMVNPKKVPAAPVVQELRQYHDPVVMRTRASWEVETDEDLDVIRDRYWQHRRQVRADEAMTRLADLVPTGSSKSK